MNEVIVVMYHYIRDVENTPYKKINAIKVDEFKYQIEYLKKEGYSFIHLDDYVSFLSGEKEIPEKCCILTFDDGFKEHYDTVFPILKKEGIPGVFYPVTQPIVEGKVLNVQKIHFLLSQITSRNFANQINERLPDKLFEKYEIHGRFKINPKKRFDDNLTSNLKHNLSRMPRNLKEELVDEIFNKYFENEKEFCKELYVDFDELGEMIKGGMIIGSQSHTHPLLSELSFDEQENEIKKSTEILEKNLKIKIKHFCYPYGDYNENTLAILENNEYSTGVTIKEGNNFNRKSKLLELKRINCNDLPKRV